MRALDIETMDYVDQMTNAVVIETVEDRPLTPLQRDGLAELKGGHGDTDVIRECTAPRFEAQ